MKLPHILFLWIISVSAVLAQSSDLKQVKKYNILAFFPDETKSNFIGYTPLLQELAAKGHNLTIVSPYSIGKTRVPHQHILVNLKPLPETNVFKKSKFMLSFFTLFFSYVYGVHYTELSLKKESVSKFIKEDQSNFDLILFENIMHEAYVVLGHKYGAPVVQLLSFGAHSSVSQWHGNPINPSYIPDQASGFVSEMTIFQRASNSAVAFLNTLFARVFYLPWQQALADKFFNYPGSRNRPPLEDMLRNISLTLLNNHFIIGSPTPLVPSFINVAGMHCQPPKQLPKDLEAIVDASKAGIVYFSLGSNIKATKMPLDAMYTIVSELSKIRQTVFWKYEGDTRPDIPPNVIIRKWFPQNDILGHPKCKLFITHGGTHSVIEATYFGVPMLAISFMGNQIQNSKYVQSRGYGIHVPYTNLSEDTMGDAVYKLLNEPSYTENAKKISAIFNDNPLTPRENAIYWIEYVIRHGGASHLQTSAKELYWYEYFLLDVLVGSFVLVYITNTCIFGLFNYYYYYTPEIPEIPEIPETPKTPETPQTPETTETPETPEIPKTPTQEEADEKKKN